MLVLPPAVGLERSQCDGAGLPEPRGASVHTCERHAEMRIRQVAADIAAKSRHFVWSRASLSPEI